MRWIQEWPQLSLGPYLAKDDRLIQSKKSKVHYVVQEGKLQGVRFQFVIYFCREKKPGKFTRVKKKEDLTEYGCCSKETRVLLEKLKSANVIYFMGGCHCHI